MDKKQMRIVIGEHLGWKLVPRLFHNQQWKNIPTWVESKFYDCKPENYCMAGQVMGVLPTDYPSEVNRAVELCAHLAGQGWRCELNNGLDTSWECVFWRPQRLGTPSDNIGNRDGVISEEHYGAGETMAIAICQSFIRAIGKWVDN